MDLFEWLMQNGQAFMFALIIFLLCIFISPLMCWINCTKIDKKLSDILEHLSTTNETNDYIDTNEETSDNTANNYLKFY